jgi:hypothetical protein
MGAASTLLQVGPCRGGRRRRAAQDWRPRRTALALVRCPTYQVKTTPAAWWGAG